MKGSYQPSRKQPQQSGRRLGSLTRVPDDDYKVGPGHPPKEYQFKPGQSGNPAGSKRKHRSTTVGLKAAVERALNAKVTLRQGERKKIISKAVAGIEQLVNQFAQGDRHARRDLITIAQTLGIDLVRSQRDLEESVEAAISANDEALLADYVRRHSCKPRVPDGSTTTVTAEQPPRQPPSEKPREHPIRRMKS